MKFKVLLFFYTAIFFADYCLAQQKIEEGKLTYIKGHDIESRFAAKDWKLEDIKKLKFEKLNSDVPNFGMYKEAVWIRFSLSNPTALNRYILEVESSTIERVDLYAFNASDSLLSEITLDKNKPFFNRRYYNPNFKFELYIPSMSTQTYYLKVQSKMPIVLPMNVSSVQVHANSLSIDYLILGIYAGIIFIMAIYNFFLFLSVRDISYIYYVLYVLGTGLTQIGVKGYNYQFLWPSNPYLEQLSIVFLGCLSGLGAILFTVNFLEIKQHFIFLYRWLMLLFFLFIITIGVLFVDRYLAFQLMQTITAISALSGLGTAVFITYKRPNFPPARFFLIAWSVLLLGSIIFLLRDYGFLGHNLFTNYAVQLSSAIEMALLSFALAARINIYRKEKEVSQARALEISQENEKLIREQNVILEEKVEERTKALTASNESLQTTLTHLKETQSQLVEAEKMASLGQLTAGVAHEINNPINFVTSNVGPLKRDVNMIWATLEEVERIAFSEELSVEEKREQINAYKDDLDIDYLKVEVDFLLKGLHDGATRTAEIVKSLRVFSRVDEDTLNYADINEGMESTLVILSSVMRGKIEVKKQYGDLPKIECFAGKLNQVFLNILTNGIYAVDKKFGDKLGGILHIETGIIPDGLSVFIKIADNGIGIPVEIRDKIFEPFFTTKDVGEGTGLGMSIVYTTMAKHGGRVELESEVGVGTTFTLIIPMTQNR